MGIGRGKSPSSSGAGIQESQHPVKGAGYRREVWIEGVEVRVGTGYFNLVLSGWLHGTGSIGRARFGEIWGI